MNAHKFELDGVPLLYFSKGLKKDGFKWYITLENEVGIYHDMNGEKPKKNSLQVCLKKFINKSDDFKKSWDLLKSVYEMLSLVDYSETKEQVKLVVRGGTSLRDKHQKIKQADLFYELYRCLIREEKFTFYLYGNIDGMRGYTFDEYGFRKIQDFNC